MKKIATLCLMVGLLWSCGGKKTADSENNTNPNSLANSTKTEQNPQWQKLVLADCLITYPDTWEVDTSKNQGPIFSLTSPLENSQDAFRENINFMIQSLAGLNMNLDTYAHLSEEQISSMIPNSTLIESKRSESADPYHILIYSGDVGPYTLQFVQHFWVKGETAYVLTFSGEKEKYEEYKKTAMDIMSSFQFRQ